MQGKYWCNLPQNTPTLRTFRLFIKKLSLRTPSNRKRNPYNGNPLSRNLSSIMLPLHCSLCSLSRPIVVVVIAQAVCGCVCVDFFSPSTFGWNVCPTVC